LNQLAKIPQRGQNIKEQIADTSAKNAPAPAGGRPGRFQGVKDWLWPNAHHRNVWVRRQLAGLPAGLKLLDVGAGEQPYRAFSQHLRYFAQDAGEYRPGDKGLQLANWQYGKLDYQSNAWEIPEKKSFFDAILCTEVLEHVPFPNETLAEFARLLRPGGTLLLTAPYAALPHMQPWFFYSGFSEEYYRFFLEKCGFEVESVSANGTTYDYLFQELVRLGLGFSAGVRIFYWLGMSLPLALLKCLALTRPQQRALVFGYHIRARKKSGTRKDSARGQARSRS
jgi:SAM-dependent methyltransferase